MLENPEVHLTRRAHGHGPVIKELMKEGKNTEQQARDQVTARLIKRRHDPVDKLMLREERKKVKELAKQSLIDPLTGLNNRRYLTLILEKEFGRAIRNDKDLTLFLIDLDSFKQVNDSYGHQAGDQLLRTFADAARKVFRLSDILARYGGDEFCFVLPETSSEQAMKLVKRFKQEYNILQAEALKKFKIDKPNSLSIGVSSLQSNSPINSIELIKFADEALYKAKESKNEIVVYRDKEHSEKI
ncbi:MAG: GGDEF domain-containing protein [Candidatus Roizmanbacteria bacterium]|nr:GGDEF domain-containing protein [Candidatus Roizmanbacteria bacterium]